MTWHDHHHGVAECFCLVFAVASFIRGAYVVSPCGMAICVYMLVTCKVCVYHCQHHHRCLHSFVDPFTYCTWCTAYTYTRIHVYSLYPHVQCRHSVYSVCGVISFWCLCQNMTDIFKQVQLIKERCYPNMMTIHKSKGQIEMQLVPFQWCSKHTCHTQRL
jgi:hypothetical protein